MLRVLLEGELNRRHLSVRAAAEQVGVAHTTLHRVINDEPIDLDTMVKLCNWLGVRPSTILDAQSDSSDVSIPSIVASLIETDSRLATIFSDLADDLKEGTVDPDDVKDVAYYIAYRLKKDDRRQTQGVFTED